MKIIFLFILVSSLLSCSFLGQPKSSELQKITMIYSGNLDGELEPCGCSIEGNLGGILRRATVLDRLRNENKELVIVSSGGLLSNRPAEHDRLTAEYILKGIGMLDYDAIGIQWQDLAYGRGFLPDDLPWVATNWQDGFFVTERKIRRDEVMLAFYSWLDPEQSPFKNIDQERQVVTDSTALLTEKLKQAKNRKETTVVATTLPIEKARQKLPMEYVDILISQAAYEEYGEPRWDNGTLVLTPGSRGMRLGKLQLLLDAKGNISEYSHDVIAMPQSIKDSPRLSKWYQEYNRKIEENYQKEVEMRKAQRQKERVYAGAKACKACHEKAYDVWKKSRHAKAYRSLSNVNKSFDPACIGCHVVGYRKPGGFIASNITKNLKNVQCESCHGAAAAHVDSKGVVQVENISWPAEKKCAQCHVQKHSPSFKFST